MNLNSKHPKYRPAMVLLADMFLDQAMEALKEMAKEEPEIQYDLFAASEFARDLAKENCGELGEDVSQAIDQLAAAAERERNNSWLEVEKELYNALASHYIIAAQNYTEYVNGNDSDPWERLDPNDEDYILDVASTMWWEESYNLKEKCRNALDYVLHEGGMKTIPTVYKKGPDCCPGCGCDPGNGLTVGCINALGCGFWKKELEAMKAKE